MNDGVDLFLAEHLRHQGLVADVAHDEGRFFTGDGLDGSRGFRRRIAEVVVQDDVVPCFQKFHGGVRTDKARAARQKNTHRSFLIS